MVESSDKTDYKNVLEGMSSMLGGKNGKGFQESKSQSQYHTQDIWLNPALNFCAKL